MTDIPGNFTTSATLEGPLAGGVAGNGTFSDTFETFADQDWIQVYLNKDTAYSFFGAAGLDSGAEGDSVLRLYTAFGAEVASADNGGAHVNSALSFTPAASGIYYLSVGEALGRIGGYGVFMSSAARTLEVLTEFADVHVAVAADARVLGGAGNDDISMGGGNLGRDALGEQGDDTLTGNLNDNLLSGGIGDDTVSGSGGNDALWGDAGNDKLFGGSGLDRLFGSAGNDHLDGGGNADELHGGAGNDALVGGDGQDSLYGDEGNDALDGNTGDDVMRGGAGNDTYFVNSTGDAVNEVGGEGTDLVKSAVNFNLATSEVFGAVENLTLIGGALKGAGNELDNRITGNASQNTLDGANGNDTLDGGANNDTLNGGTGNDVVVGGAGKDKLIGDIGDDRLIGEAGNDKLDAGSGKDRLIGGIGADELRGGGSADRFVFQSVAESTAAANGRDTIVDFDHAHGDRIELSLVDANAFKNGNQAFHFIGLTPFTHNQGELRYTFTNGDTLIQGDVNGDAKADFAVLLTGLKALVAADFLL